MCTYTNFKTPTAVPFFYCTRIRKGSWFRWRARKHGKTEANQKKRDFRTISSINHELSPYWGFFLLFLFNCSIKQQEKWSRVICVHIKCNKRVCVFNEIKIRACDQVSGVHFSKLDQWALVQTVVGNTAILLRWQIPLKAREKESRAQQGRSIERCTFNWDHKTYRQLKV